MFGKRLVIFRKGGGGGGGTPFTENSTKIINLIFEPFPKTGPKYLKGVYSIQQGSLTFAKQKVTLAFTFIPQLQKKTQTRRMP